MMTDLKRGKTFQWAIFIFPALFLTFCLRLKCLPKPTYYILISEDGIFESLQFVFYFLACLWAGRIAMDFIKSKKGFIGAMYTLLALALLFITGEEISWGQRIFHFSLPKYFQIHNVQHEITIHNLDVIQPEMAYFSIVFGLYGSIGWLFIKIFKSKIRSYLNWFFPDWYLSVYFIPTFLLNLYYALGAYFYKHGRDILPIGKFIIWKDQEVTELLQAFGFLLYMIVIRLMQKKSRARDPGNPSKA